MKGLEDFISRNETKNCKNEERTRFLGTHDKAADPAPD